MKQPKDSPCRLCTGRRSSTCHIYCEDYKEYCKDPTYDPNPVHVADQYKRESYEKHFQRQKKINKAKGRMQ